MGREIRYCDRCAQLVSPGDIASGKATATDDLVLCASCTKLQTAEQASAPKPSAPVAAASPAAVRPRSRCVPERPAGGSQAKTFAIATVVAALVTVPVAVLVMRGRGERPGTNRPRRPSVAGPRVPSPRVPKPRTPTPTSPGPPAAPAGRDAAAAAGPRDEGLASTTPNPGPATTTSGGDSSTTPAGVGSRPATGSSPEVVDRRPGVYEPFDSQRSASARGFDGPWQGGMQAAEDSMPWGPLPVKGNRGKSVRDTRPWHTTSHRRIAPHALKDAGLLRDGTTLWLSAVVPLSDYSFALGSTPFYCTRDSDFFRNRRNLRDGGQGIGFSHSKGGMQSTVWVDGRRRLEGGAKRGSKKDKPRGTALVVLKVAWGSDGKPDRVQLFMANEKLQLGEVVSEISADIDQESLEYISYSGGVGTPIDEIRIGASYEDVMGNAAELKAAADARKKAAAEAEAKAKLKAALAEFDRLMAERQYEKASEHIKSKATADGKDSEIMRVAARVAQMLARVPADAARGAKMLVGQQQRLKLVRRTVNVTIEGVSREGLDVTREFTINNQTRTKRSTMKWRELHPSQQASYARLGGLKLGEAEAHIVEAYLSLAAGDIAGARKSVEKATDHPLKAHFSDLLSKSGK